MPAAARRIVDIHTCTMVTGTVPHVGGPILPSPETPTVFIGGMPAACAGDKLICAGGQIDTISKGSKTVLINRKPAARMRDTTAHGGIITIGCPTVIIGG